MKVSGRQRKRMAGYVMRAKLAHCKGLLDESDLKLRWARGAMAELFVQVQAFIDKKEWDELQTWVTACTTPPPDDDTAGRAPMGGAKLQEEPDPS